MGRIKKIVAVLILLAILLTPFSHAWSPLTNQQMYFNVTGVDWTSTFGHLGLVSNSVLVDLSIPRAFEDGALLESTLTFTAYDSNGNFIGYMPFYPYDSGALVSKTTSSGASW